MKDLTECKPAVLSFTIAASERKRTRKEPEPEKQGAEKGTVEQGTPEKAKISQLGVEEAEAMELAAGSMGPKVQAAARFARRTGKVAAIGSLADIADIVAGRAGTRVG